MERWRSCRTTGWGVGRRKTFSVVTLFEVHGTCVRRGNGVRRRKRIVDKEEAFIGEMKWRVNMARDVIGTYVLLIFSRHSIQSPFVGRVHGIRLRSCRANDVLGKHRFIDSGKTNSGPTGTRPVIPFLSRRKIPAGNLCDLNWFIDSPSRSVASQQCRSSVLLLITLIARHASFLFVYLLIYFKTKEKFPKKRTCYSDRTETILFVVPRKGYGYYGSEF